SAPLTLRLVAAGFGGFAAGGGFVLDHRALRSIERDRRTATVRVLGLGAMEYAVIAPAACLASLVMLVVGSAVMGAVLLPWPLAGAGITEILLSLALLWVGLGLASALAGVLAYRLFSFALPMVAAIRAHRSVSQLLAPDTSLEVSAEALANGTVHKAPLKEPA